MKLNMTNMEATSDKLPNETIEPSWWEQAVAAKEQTLATGISTSAMNYSGEAFRNQLDEMAKDDPDLDYDALKTITGKQLDLYEMYYKEGTLEHFALGRGGVTAEVLKTYFDNVEASGRYDVKGLYDVGKGYAARDYYEAEEVLQRGDSVTAKLAGGMVGAMHDPINIALLPVGGTVVKGAGQSILGTAARAAGQEMAISTAAEVPIQVAQMNWSEEVGVKYGVKEAATNAVLSIGVAGLLRGTGSAAFDLTADGVKALRAVDPQLADEYTELVKNNISSDVKEHIDNLSRVELGEDPVIKNPLSPANELKFAEPLKEFKDTPEFKTPLIDYDGDLTIITGKNVDGEVTYASYKDMANYTDDELNKIKMIEDCIL